MKKILLLVALMFSVTLNAQYSESMGDTISVGEMDSLTSEFDSYCPTWTSTFTINASVWANLLDENDAIGVMMSNAMDGEDNPVITLHPVDENGEKITSLIYSSVDGGTEITPSEADDMIGNFENYYDDWHKDISQGADILNDLLDQTDCEGINIHYGMEDSRPWHQHFILVGYDSNEDPITSMRAQRAPHHVYGSPWNKPKGLKLPPPN